MIQDYNCLMMFLECYSYITVPLFIDLFGIVKYAKLYYQDLSGKNIVDFY